MSENSKTKHGDKKVAHDSKPKTNVAEEDTEIVDVADAVDTDGDPELGGKSEIEALKDLLNETQQKLDKEKNEYLFLMAEFDNFRKRVVKEKADLVKNAAEKALKDLLPIVDDFERGLEAAKATDDAEAVREGMEIIYNKLVKYLADNGVKAMESTGTDFDSDNHEAIATIPAPTPEMKGKVIDTTTKGYTINDKVLRHAKVVVGE